MENDLAGTKQGISERFVPEQDRGRLIEVEHLCRYLWAGQLTAGRVALDAGCGTAYGTRLLAEGGAREVVGVDIAGSVLDSVAPTMPPSVRLVTGDLRALPFTDDTFELVVCFEVIEHFEDPFTVMDELVRVLSPGGLLLISSPNRGFYPAGNPHHFHEFTPSELSAELTARLRHVHLFRQSNYLVSALLADESHEQADGGQVADLALRKLEGGVAGEETYTVAMASDSSLPDVPQLGAMAGTLEFREWLTLFESQSGVISQKDADIDALEGRLQERDQLARLLTDAEQRLALVPELELRIADLEYELADARSAAEAARREARELDQMLMYGRRALRYVRPLIKPMRDARRRLRSR